QGTRLSISFSIGQEREVSVPINRADHDVDLAAEIKDLLADCKIFAERAVEQADAVGIGRGQRHPAADELFDSNGDALARAGVLVRLAPEVHEETLERGGRAGLLRKNAGVSDMAKWWHIQEIVAAARQTDEQAQVVGEGVAAAQ